MVLNIFVYLFRFVQFFHSQTSLHSVRNVQKHWFCPRQFTEHLLQGQSRWSSLGLSVLLKGRMAVVNGLSLVGFKPTTFWLTAQILNYKSAQLWGRHVRDLIMSDWGEYRTLSNYLTVVHSSHICREKCTLVKKKMTGLQTGQSCISNPATICEWSISTAEFKQTTLKLAKPPRSLI